MPFKIVRKEAFVKKCVATSYVRPEPVKNNIKIHMMDLEIIDLLARSKGISRAELLNFLVDRIILKFLKSFDDTNESSLLIQVADKINKVNAWYNLKDSWYSDLYPGEVNQSIEYELYGKDSVFSENSKTPAHLYMLKRIKENLLRNGCEFEKPQVNDCSDSVDFNEANLEEGVR